jgi:hypothetical protein
VSWDKPRKSHKGGCCCSDLCNILSVASSRWRVRTKQVQVKYTIVKAAVSSQCLLGAGFSMFVFWNFFFVTTDGGLSMDVYCPGRLLWPCSATPFEWCWYFPAALHARSWSAFCAKVSPCQREEAFDMRPPATMTQTNTPYSYVGFATLCSRFPFCKKKKTGGANFQMRRHWWKWSCLVDAIVTVFWFVFFVHLGELLRLLLHLFFLKILVSINNHTTLHKKVGEIVMVFRRLRQGYVTFWRVPKIVGPPHRPSCIWRNLSPQGCQERQKWLIYDSVWLLERARKRVRTEETKALRFCWVQHKIRSSLPAAHHTTPHHHASFVFFWCLIHLNTSSRRVCWDWRTWCQHLFELSRSFVRLFLCVYISLQYLGVYMACHVRLFDDVRRAPNSQFWQLWDFRRPAVILCAIIFSSGLTFGFCRGGWGRGGCNRRTTTWA